MPDAENLQMPSMMPLMVMMFLILALYMIDGSNNVIRTHPELRLVHT